MSSTPTIVLSVLLAAAAATGVSFALRPAAASVPPSDANAELLREVAELRRASAALEKQIQELRAAPVVAAGAPAVATERTAAAPTDEQVLAAVESILKRREGGAANATAAQPGFDLARDFPGLVGTSYWTNTDAWTKAQKAGRLQEVLAKFEAAAKASPNDPKVQMDLANAYLAALQMEPGDYSGAGRADAALDRVLAIDGQHWEARFTKAMSYTFWPDFTGKPKEAITHFETLVAQQETMPVTDDQAQTYLYLGNLLEKSDLAKAKEYWQKGARRHPNNQELRKKAGG